MTTYTLLDLTQKILSSMDADEINSITDSVESTQVVEVIESVYNEIISTSNLPEHYTLFNLDPVGVASPTSLTKPSNIDEMLWFKYNKIQSAGTDDWGPVEYVEPEVFLEFVQSFSLTNTNVRSYSIVFGSNSTTLYYENDRAPRYWTSFDDNTVVCDAYDSAVEANLQKSKTACYGRSIPPFTRSDTFIPDLDDQQFTLLLNEAKALAWAEMKQAVHAKAEKKVRESKVYMQAHKYDTRKPNSALDRLPHYGRK